MCKCLLAMTALVVLLVGQGAAEIQLKPKSGDSKAAADRAAADKAAHDKAAADKAAADRAADRVHLNEKALQERSARDLQRAMAAARQKEAREKAAREKAAREKAETAKHDPMAGSPASADRIQAAIEAAFQNSTASRFGQPRPSTFTEHGYWGGMDRAPAERLIGEKTPSSFSKLEAWAQDKIKSGNLPQPVDGADRAAMIHDIRLKWARDHMDKSLGFKSADPVIAYINKLAYQDFQRAAADQSLSAEARRFAERASVAFRSMTNLQPPPLPPPADLP